MKSGHQPSAISHYLGTPSEPVRQVGTGIRHSGGFRHPEWRWIPTNWDALYVAVEYNPGVGA